MRNIREPFDPLAYLYDDPNWDRHFREAMAMAERTNRVPRSPFQSLRPTYLAVVRRPHDASESSD